VQAAAMQHQLALMQVGGLAALGSVGIAHSCRTALLNMRRCPQCIPPPPPCSPSCPPACLAPPLCRPPTPPPCWLPRVCGCLSTSCRSTWATISTTTRPPPRPPPAMAWACEPGAACPGWAAPKPWEEHLCASRALCRSPSHWVPPAVALGIPPSPLVAPTSRLTRW
jgi:hypothetical protein